jgi:hypothetical protein
MLAILATVTIPPTVAKTTPASEATQISTTTSTQISTPASTPMSTPISTPTVSTFSFTQQYYGAWIQLSDSPFSSATLLAYSWGYRTGVYGGYFYATTEATRTSLAGQTNLYSALATGTSSGTATGTVTGILGQALTGTMTYTGTNSYGNTITRTGKVTILPTGELIYNWTDTVTGSGGVAKATGVGTTTQNPGTYFSQTATGQYSSTANLAGNQITATNYGNLTGTRVMDGITTRFRAGFSATVTAPNAGTFTSGGPTSDSVTSQGVLGAPDASGVRTGVMTNTVTAGTGSHVSGGPVRYVPATSTTPDAMFAQLMYNPPGTSYTGVGMWAQTSDTSAQIITQTYQGSSTVSPPNTSTGTLNSTGWGIRTESTGTTSNTTPTLGSLTATLTDTGGGTFSSDPDLLNQTSAAVVQTNGTTRTGPAQSVGIFSGKGVFSTTGTANFDASNNLAQDFSGTWVSPTSQGSIISGNQTLTPGTYFTQTTNSGTGSMTLSASTGTGPFTQTSTLSADMTRTGVAPSSTLVLTPGAIITGNTATPNAFPAAATVGAVINMEGVVAQGGTIRSGNMTMTINQTTSNQTVSTYMGPVSIDTGTGALNATVVGRNYANPGVNRVPARQAGTIVSTP